MAIMCPRVPLPPRASILNVDLNEIDIVPPILIEKCTMEIERRYIGRNGIYRMSGVASRVEKLLKSFESGPHLIDLSDVSGNDLASVLKVFLRQVCRPIPYNFIPFHQITFYSYPFNTLFQIFFYPSALIFQYLL